MLPVVMVAAGAVPAAWIIARFGLRRAIVAGLLVMTAGSVGRGQVPSSTELFIVSAIMGLGVALFQTALPAATRVWTPTHVALGSAVYLNGMMLGELSGAGLTLPVVLPLAGGDWRMALVLWAIPILLITLLVAFVRLPKPSSDNEPETAPLLPQYSPLPKDAGSHSRIWQSQMFPHLELTGPFVLSLLANSREARSLCRETWTRPDYFHHLRP